MKTWFALLAAPALVLADQVIAYATVGWACSHERIAAVHAVHALFIFAAAAGLFPAWRLWTATRAAGNEQIARRHFLAGIAVATCALSLLVIAAMWMPTWVIAPCAN
jgi:hypothetical protein